MKISNLVLCSVLAGFAIAPAVQAVPSIAVNGFVTADLAPPAGSTKSDAESGSPLVRDAVSVADSLPDAWAYSAVSDITVPKLAILGSINNSNGGALTGAFGGEIPLMRVSATLRDTINIIAPSADPYIVTAELEIDGQLEVGGSDGRVNALLTMAPINKLSNTQSRTYSTDITVVGDKLPISYQFIGDAQFDLSSSLFFFVTHVDAGATVLADFSNTAIINLTVTSLGGELIPDVVIESASRQFGSAPVPLPASLPLLAAALVLAACRRHRRG